MTVSPSGWVLLIAVLLGLLFGALCEGCSSSCLQETDFAQGHRSNNDFFLGVWARGGSLVRRWPSRAEIEDVISVQFLR